MAAPSSVRLLSVEPDIGRFLTEDERTAAAVLSVPVREVAQGAVRIDVLLADANAFGAFILKGMLLHRLQVGDQPALRLLGPGDIVSLSGTAPSMLVDSRCNAAAPTQLALLGNEVLLASHRWPRLVAGLHVRMAEQAERLETQLAICQLPRVDQRLLALMWLLAESWGHVTPVGTRLPLVLTHDALGGLTGARRPTVTLALRDLTDRGAIVRQDDTWLLLEGPPEPSDAVELPGEPLRIEPPGSDWSDEAAKPTAATRARAELKETVRRLREDHALNRERFEERMSRIANVREQAARSRRLVADGALSRRRAPSS